MVKNVYATRYFCQILMKLEFYRQIFRRILVSIFISFHKRPYGRRDMTKLIVTFFFFCNFSKPPKIWWILLKCFVLNAEPHKISVTPFQRAVLQFASVCLRTACLATQQTPERSDEKPNFVTFPWEFKVTWNYLWIRSTEAQTGRSCVSLACGIKFRISM